MMIPKKYITYKTAPLIFIFVILIGFYIFTLPCNASRHEYRSLPLFGLTSPGTAYSPSLGHKHWVNNSEDNSYILGGYFKVYAENDAYSSDYDSVYLKKSQSNLYSSFSNNQCSYSNISPTFNFSNNNGLFISSQGFMTSDNFHSDSNYYMNHCRYLQEFGHGNNSPFDSNSLPFGLMACGRDNGAVCGGLIATSVYVSDQVLPYPYSSAVLGTYGSAQSSEGITYSHSFSPLTEMFNKKIDKFSYLSLPLVDYSDYWTTPSNFPEGRHFNFTGQFDFTDTVNANPDFITNSGTDPDTGVFLHYNAVTYYDNDFNVIDTRIKCQARIVNGQVGDSPSHRFEYECPIDLPDSYLYFRPYLEIDGNGHYVWSSDGDWKFSVILLITDNDYTPGQDFGTDFKGGGGYIFGDPANYVPTSSHGNDESLIDTIFNFLDNFRQNLFNLFGFNFLNPFAPLFALFTTGDECVNIPIIAGMVHSEENTVCPWFPAQVRNIVTPVIMFVALMILFGFVVRWSKSSSSDFSPISKGGHE